MKNMMSKVPKPVLIGIGLQAIFIRALISGYNDLWQKTHRLACESCQVKQDNADQEGLGISAAQNRHDIYEGRTGEIC